MALDSFPTRFAQHEVVMHVVRFVGGAAAATKVDGTGQGVTVTYVGSGVINLEWEENPGTFLGAVFSVQAATPNNVDTYTVTADEFDTSTYTLPITLSEGGTPTDLAASEWCSCLVMFKAP